MSVNAYSVDGSKSITFASGDSEYSEIGMLQSDVGLDNSSVFGSSDWAWIAAIILIFVLVVWWVYSVRKNKNRAIAKIVKHKSVKKYL
jgi:hypothetical protein